MSGRAHTGAESTLVVRVECDWFDLGSEESPGDDKGHLGDSLGESPENLLQYHCWATFGSSATALLWWILVARTGGHSGWPHASSVVILACRCTEPGARCLVQCAARRADLRPSLAVVSLRDGTIGGNVVFTVVSDLALLRDLFPSPPFCFGARLGVMIGPACR